jgi:hypothetical protein
MLSLKDEEVQAMIEIIRVLEEYCLDLRFFASTEGYIGWMPASAEIGDFIMIFQGCPIPMTIRDVGRGYHRIVGPAYVDGIMEGQFMETYPNIQTFLLE